MPLSVDALVSRIDEEAGRWSSVGDAIAAARRRALLRLRDTLRRTGFPTDRDHRLEVSLVPLVFQEANYDGISWVDRSAPLGHLSRILEIDVAAQSAGHERNELTDAEYDDYVEMSFAAIDRRNESR